MLTDLFQLFRSTQAERLARRRCCSALRPFLFTIPSYTTPVAKKGSSVGYLEFDWDTPLTGDDASSLARIFSEVHVLEEIEFLGGWRAGSKRISSKFKSTFADASEKAYGAVLYLRTEDSEGIRVRLITAKTRVAPIKQITLPRLELCAATLLVRLASHVRQVLQLEEVPIHLWSIQLLR
ncbi:hypothetical protein DMN91_007743 [Ooceraea biroi]|uniref:Uncharacterized protein n=1 Tax=Ooceraea biroi TaxID=2015173 RepID=A0A3L8DFV7_OOCBI|nr:hypothetical protein DMN91_007743 [Ooceraea biroi]